MEMNNPTVQPPAPSIPQTPLQAPILQIPPNKKVPWIAIGLLVVILVIGGGYLLFGKQILNNNTSKLPPLTINTQAPVPASAPAEENLENDLNSIDVEAGASDFNTVDQDLQQL